MHLLIDIGNSTIVAALATPSGSIDVTWRFKTQKGETAHYFTQELRAGMQQHHIDAAGISRVIISSVVPEVNGHVSQAIEMLTGHTPHFFTIDDALSAMPVAVENPRQLGTDRLADALGAASCYLLPAIVFDMGTATTVGLVSHDGTFMGGMIIPGVKTSLNALCQRASQLPSVSVEAPSDIIGRNTVEAMQSGIVHGTASMLDGIIDRLSAIIGHPATIVATGGMSRVITPHCTHHIVCDPYLQFRGILRAVMSNS